MLDQKGKQVIRVQTVAHLVAGAAEADVFEWRTLRPTVNPIAENSLVGLAELPRAGHHPAAVDPHGKTERRAVFQGDLLARQLARAIKRNRRGGGKTLGDTTRSDRGQRFGQDEGAILGDNRQGAQSIDRINTTRAEQDHTGLLALADFEQVDRAPKIVLEQFLAPGLAVDSGQHARVGRRIDHPIDTFDPGQIFLLTHVATPKLDARRLDARTVPFAARTAKIIEPADLIAGRTESEGQFGPDKSTDAADQYAHKRDDNHRTPLPTR